MVNFILINKKRQSQIWKVENFSNICHIRNIMFKAYKDVKMEFAEKWIGFVFDSEPDMAKAQRFIREVSLIL